MREGTCFGVPQYMNCLGDAGSGFEEDKEQTPAAPSPQPVPTVSGGFSHSCKFSSRPCTPISRDSPDSEQHLAGNCGFRTSPNSPHFIEEGSLLCVQPSREPGTGSSRWQQSPARAGCARERSVWEGLAVLQALKSHLFALLTLIRPQRAALPVAWLEPAQAAAGTEPRAQPEAHTRTLAQVMFYQGSHSCKGTSGS